MNQKGQGLVEYALILVLVGVIVVIIVALLGPSIGNIICRISAKLNDGQGLEKCPIGDVVNSIPQGNHIKIYDVVLTMQGESQRIEYTSIDKQNSAQKHVLAAYFKIDLTGDTNECYLDSTQSAPVFHLVMPCPKPAQ